MKNPPVTGLVVVVVVIMLLPFAVQAEQPRVIKNPYAAVNWDEVNQYIANFHAHTILSDGRAEPDELIHAYANTGYHILAISDHDNYHVTREGEREVPPTTATTWPWSRWIDEAPSHVWYNSRGDEASAFYPTLGAQGMFAIRANELTQDPHICSLFNICGFPKRDRAEEQRMNCIENTGGLSYWAHPTDYVPGGRWEMSVVDNDWDEAVAYFARYIAEYDSNLGIEMQLGGRKERDLKLFDRLLAELYPEHNVFIKGSDDRHGTAVRHGSVMTIVLAEELTQDAVRYALENGHKFVAQFAAAHPTIKGIDVDESDAVISLDIENANSVNWIRNGEPYHTGSTVDFSGMQNAVLRFEVEYDGGTLYSQGFYVE